MKRRELIVAAILILIALAGFLVVGAVKNTESDAVLVITLDGEVVHKLPLTKNTNEAFRVETEDGHWNDVVIIDGVVDIIDADCPRQICVETIPASEIGDMIVCLPHKLVAEIIPAE